MDNTKRILQTFHSMKVKMIMPPIDSMPIVSEDSPIVDALEFLKSRHHVWVVDNKDEMKLKGVVRYLNVIDVLLPPETQKAGYGSITTLFKSILGGAEKAIDVMERNVLSIKDDATVLDALNKMRRYKVQLLVIVDESDRLVGEVSLRILINEFLRLLKPGDV